ncbi:hypothetical protein FOA52_010837 [Chlamydomonas sp. UWO 241]|nr:hypothetical protein FOA52_010837 [Chlamydomonas sp. UWO 241]
MRSTGTRVRLFPFVPPGPADINGRVVSHKLAALGHWSDDVQSHLFSFVDLQVSTRDGALESTSLDTLGTWQHAGAVTDICLADLGGPGSEVLVATASSRGGICLARLSLPRVPGTSPEDVQIVDLASEDQRFTPWAVPHGAVSVVSVDVQPESKLILSASSDGGLCFLNPASSGEPAPEWLRKGGGLGYQPLAAARWADSALAVAADATGCLQLWDARRAPGTPAGTAAVASSPKGWGCSGAAAGLPPACRPHAQWLDVHASRPNLCCVGSGGGGVAVWDLRMTTKPISVRVGGGEVWEARFDADEATCGRAASAVPPVLYCSEGGGLGLASSDGHAGLAPSGLLLSAPSGVTSFDVEAGGQDIVATTDSQALVYVRRARGV